MKPPIPVIDLFSGPGGLSEGFARCGRGEWESELSGSLGTDVPGPSPETTFDVRLSIEMDPIAHRTLALRAFTRQFQTPPPEYYRYVRGEISEQEMLACHTTEAAIAATEAWNATLGVVPEAELDRRISGALSGSDLWILLGGPPCQAYSLAGRSRNKGIKGYEARNDSRHFLYKEYLRIVAKHAPPVFVMENVKGLLSATVDGVTMFDLILEDLSKPSRVVSDADPLLEYDILPCSSASGPFEPKDYVLKMEEYGIPQARHRVILVGIRKYSGYLTHFGGGLPRRKSVPAWSVLQGLPVLRSGVSGDNGPNTWLTELEAAQTSEWFKQVKSADWYLAQRITKSLGKLRSPRGSMGAPFIKHKSGCGYAPSWFVDPLVGGVLNHEARTHMVSDLHRYLFATCFAQEERRSPGLGDFPSKLLPDHENAAASAISGNGFSDRFRVQLRNRPSTTVTSHISKDGHYYIHPDPLQCRALTVREAARLQTFPDNYFFCGPKTQQYRQVGNAVPPLFATQIATRIARLLTSSRTTDPTGPLAMEPQSASAS